MMQLNSKANSSVQSSLNNSTDSPLFNLIPHSPSAQTSSPSLVPKQGDVLPLEPKLTANTLNKQRYSLSRIGVLSTVLALGIGTFLALPSLLSCAGTAKQAEAKNNLGALNRAQQSYYLEFKTFTNSLTDLGVGIKAQSVNYNYSIRTTKTVAFHYAIARKGTLKSYVGAVFRVPTTEVHSQADQDETPTVAITCEAVSPGYSQPKAPTLVNGVPTCDSGTTELAVGSYPTHPTTVQ